MSAGEIPGPAGSAEETQARFDRLQARLVPLWKSIQSFNQDPQTMVVVPSMWLDAATLAGADPKFFPLGSKSGCRRLVAEEGGPHPLGREGLKSVDEVASAIALLRSRKPGIRAVIVKLNEGVSGEGNASVDLENLPPPGG